MDLLDLIRNQIKALPPGEHRPGLQSVLNHIEIAYKHFARGQSEHDEFLFNDTIYRTNQAFEGSVKEAYRVLAGKEPSKMLPFEIEQYLEKQNIFGERILAQFTNYRTKWRNPSTHDYNLTFDEAEAFLAIVSVSAFTKLLVDEIAERLSYVAVQQDAASESPTIQCDLTEPLIIRTVSALIDFPKYYRESLSSVPIESEAQLMGALAAFLTSALPSAQTTTGRIIHGARPLYVDMIVTENNTRVLIEIKRGDAPSLVDRGVEQLLTYLVAAGEKDAILFLYSEKTVDYDVTFTEGPRTGTDVYVVRPISRSSELKPA